MILAVVFQLIWHVLGKPAVDVAYPRVGGVAHVPLTFLLDRIVRCLELQLTVPVIVEAWVVGHRVLQLAQSYERRRERRAVCLVHADTESLHPTHGPVPMVLGYHVGLAEGLQLACHGFRVGLIEQPAIAVMGV